MKSSRLGSAHCRSSNRRTVGARSETRSKNLRQAAKSSSRSYAAAVSRPSRTAMRGSSQLPLVRVADELAQRVGELAHRELRLRHVVDPDAPPDHLGDGGERDVVAVGGCPPGVPRHGAGEGVETFLELPGQPALADARDAGDRDEPASSVARDAVEELDQLAQLPLAADERAGVCAVPSPRHRTRSVGDPERGEGRGATLQGKGADGLESGSIAGLLAGCLVDEHPSDGRLRLEPRGHAHQDAGNHALPNRPDRHGCLAARDRRPRLQRVPHGAAQPADRVDERDRGTNRALRIVLVRGRRAPDRHHRVADELLDRPAVARHDRARHFEVARLDRAHLLRIERLGKGGEVLEVDEQDRDTAPLGRPRRVIPLDVGGRRHPHPRSARHTRCRSARRG